MMSFVSLAQGQLTRTRETAYFLMKSRP